jgi:hypothetical protein
MVPNMKSLENNLKSRINVLIVIIREHRKETNRGDAANAL